MKTYRLVNVGGVIASILVAAGSAWAQTAPAPAPAPAPAAAAPAPAPAPAPAAEAAPAPAPAAAPAEPAPAPAAAAAPAPAPAAAVAGESDHDMMVGRFALGYLGMRSMLIGAGLGSEAAGGTGEQPTATVNAPVVGIRFWASQVVGLDGGIGFYTNWGSNSTDLRDPLDPANTNQAVSTTLSGTTAFLVHVGVPLALAGAKHFSFQVTPEVNIGFATQSVNPQPPVIGTTAMPKVSNTGLHFDVGARAGAELHFGFIGVEQLSLQGGIGLLLAIDNTKSSQGSLGESSRSRGSISTTVNDNPWNIFISNIAALYYF